MPPNVTRQNPTGPAAKQADDVISRIRPVSEGRKKDTFNIYGGSGTGKTTLAADWEKPLLRLFSGCKVPVFATNADFSIAIWLSSAENLAIRERQMRKPA